VGEDREASEMLVAQNTDKELWRTTESDYYSKHKLYVTKSGGLTLCEAGHCITLPPEDWFRLANTRIFGTRHPTPGASGAQETGAARTIKTDNTQALYNCLAKIKGMQADIMKAKEALSKERYNVDKDFYTLVHAVDNALAAIEKYGDGSK